MKINQISIIESIRNCGFDACTIEQNGHIKITHNSTYGIDLKENELISIVKYNSTLQEGQLYHWQFKDIYNFIYWLIHTKKYY